MMGTAKTPVSILNEYMFRAKEVPEFRLIQSVTGPDPAFEYEVTVDKIKAKGCGRSKKEAKHNAAHNALVELAKSDDLIRKQLLTCCGISATRAADRNDSDIAQVAASPYAEQIKINAVGELSTLCALNDLPTPEYKVVEESGPAHCKTFKMHCIIHNLIGIGEARTKQQAKHISAQRMMDKLKEHIEKPATGIEYDIMNKSDVNSKDHTVAKRNYCALKEKDRGTTIKENLKLNLATCHLNLRGLVGTEVQALKEKKTPYVDPEVILNRFAEEQQVKYSYEIINSQKGQDNSEEYLCAAMLTTVPELVQFGFASSPELARDVAANSLFKCLITMLED